MRAIRRFLSGRPPASGRERAGDIRVGSASTLLETAVIPFDSKVFELRSALDSALAQTYPLIEIIIVQDDPATYISF